MRRKAGVPDGFDEAFRPLFVMAFRVAERITGSKEDAEDVASETMARTLASWRRVGGLDYRDAWVQRVAANVAIDVLRKRRTTDVTVTDVPDIQVASDERMALADGLSRLSRRQRDVLALRYLADMAESDVAESLRMSPGSVKRHAHRGTSRLRLLLSPDDQEVEVAY